MAQAVGEYGGPPLLHGGPPPTATAVGPPAVPAPLWRAGLRRLDLRPPRHLHHHPHNSIHPPPTDSIHPLPILAFASTIPNIVAIPQCSP
jgi:hypothetical protein